VSGVPMVGGVGDRVKRHQHHRRFETAPRTA
jgi:hypothetical protein